MNPLTQILQVLSRKTKYLVAISVFVLLFGQWQGWWKIDPTVYTALMAIELMLLRAGVAKGPSSGPSTGNTATTALPGTRLPPLSLLTFASIMAATFFFIGCAELQPGADPLVVNVERSEVIAQSSFQLVLDLDNSDRGFWRTNAPAFHEFCEWLRQPMIIADSSGTNTLPRGLGMIQSLDDVKNSYEASTTTSNALLEALATLQSAANQASSWSSLITNTPTP